jgi:uncharacterized membrane protein HdeD (DUF308 family)
MDTQSTLLLLVSAVLIVAGIAQLVHSRRHRHHARHPRDRTGIALILIGGLLLLILLATGGIVLS